MLKVSKVVSTGGGEGHVYVAYIHIYGITKTHRNLVADRHIGTNGLADGQLNVETTSGDGRLNVAKTLADGKFQLETRLADGKFNVARTLTDGRSKLETRLADGKLKITSTLAKSKDVERRLSTSEKVVDGVRVHKKALEREISMLGEEKKILEHGE